MLLDTDTLTEDDYEVARVAIQEVLVEFRDGHISLVGRGNGLVIRSKDGSDSPIIRLGPEDAVRIGLKAIVEHRKRREKRGKEA